MEYYAYNGNKILIAHFPGNTKRSGNNPKLLEEFSKRRFNKPDNIGIVCAITNDQVATSPLHNQLQLNGYDYYNFLKDKTVLWKNERKVLFVLNSLKMCKEEYSLILDGNDVAILSDLDYIFELFNSYGKRILYNASIWMYPHTLVEHVKDREQYGDYCFLNAGCAFGKTSDLIKFYEEVWDIVKSDPYPVSSEQYYIRKVFDYNQDEVFFDWECKIFQCWHKQDYRYETINNEERCILL